MRTFIIAVLAVFSLTEAAAAQSYSETSAKLSPAARAWANSLSDPKSFPREWESDFNLYQRGNVAFRYENGVLRRAQSDKVMVNNLKFVRTYEEGTALVHEFSATCFGDFSTTPINKTFKVMVLFGNSPYEPAYKPGEMTGFVRARDACGHSMKYYGPRFK